MGNTIISYFQHTPVIEESDNSIVTESNKPIILEKVFSEIGECRLCRDENILITLFCEHQFCIECFHSQKYYIDKSYCVICDKPQKICKVSVFSV